MADNEEDGDLKHAISSTDSKDNIADESAVQPVDSQGGDVQTENGVNNANVASYETDAQNVSGATASQVCSASVESKTETNTAVIVKSDEGPATKQSLKTEPVLGHLGPTKQVVLTSPLPSFVNSFRLSAVTAIKRTRQTLSEKLGRGTKTIDAELEARVESLRMIQKRYSDVMQLARAFSTHFSALVNCQQALAVEFSDLAQKMPELRSEFAYNAETQRALFKNGETLLGAVNFFISTLNTLCFKTIEDTLVTVKQYDEARLEFDAYRSDVESNGGTSKSPELQQSYEQHREKFEQLRKILDIKLKFLDENKVKVMHQQLVLFHNAIAAYFAGNQTALDDTLKQFSIKLKSPNAGIPSWLENQD